MSNCLWSGKVFWYITHHQDQLRFPFFWCR